ncbi:MAG TPA: hypothetical protein VM734_08090 [Kofleriaceae bacterium]|nr:hypothetical protein [Kofleriaceae bacterium]
MRTRTLLILFLGLVACGGEEDPPPPPPKAAQPAKPAAAKAGAAGAKSGTPPGTLTTYRKIEDRVTEKERDSIRHQFRERDFVPDPTGTESRDPFRSYVITQPGVGVNEPGIPVEATEVCPIKKQIARGYGVRDLRLVGIVSRGTTRYAMFSDTRQEGHIVRRGDCLGTEKARVKEIGAGFVTLEVSPEQVNNQAPRAPEERSIPLHPKELQLDEPDDEEPARSRSSIPFATPAPSPVTGGGNL